MNTNAFHKKTVADNSGSDSFDPALREQIETSLDGAYRFNADTAKFGVIWVWLVKTPAVITAVMAVLSAVAGVMLLITGGDIQLFEKSSGSGRFIFNLYDHQTLLFFGGALGLSVVSAFFWYMTKAMSVWHETALRMAAKYKKVCSPD